MAHSAELALSHVESSNLPTREKSAIRKWYESAVARHGSTIGRAKGHVRASGHAARQGAESAATGAALGAAHVYLKNGLDIGKVPADAALGVAGLAASVWLAQDGMSDDLRNVGSAALTVFAFRKTFKMLGEKRAQTGKAVGGLLGPGIVRVQGEADYGAEDPIVALARKQAF